MNAPAPDPLMTRPPLPVVAVATVLLAFALLTPADPVYRAGAAFAAILILLVVRDRSPRTEPAQTSSATTPTSTPGAPAAPQPPQAATAPLAPAGDTCVTLTDPGPTPDDVAWVWRQFRSLDPSEERTPEEFAEQLTAAGTNGSEVLAAGDLTPEAADALARSLRKAGAVVVVSPQAP